MIEVFEKQPEGFVPKVEVAACYVEIDGRILLLQVGDHKSEPGKWGVPAGKKESGETIENTAQRELFEETGILVSSSAHVEHVGALYLRKPEVDYVYHMFRVRLHEIPVVQLSAEHQGYIWASAQEVDQMPLMAGAKEALEKFRSS
ncbi:MAG: NUDIX hydrolase [Verrucomicrobia bacterium]|nr:NUDIX hydrolase [Verrucomicrobiota bacterium]